VDIFLNQLIQFYLNNSPNLRTSTPHIIPCYTHKMWIVSRPSITWRHLALCVASRIVSYKAEKRYAADRSETVNGYLNVSVWVDRPKYQDASPNARRSGACARGLQLSYFRSGRCSVRSTSLRPTQQPAGLTEFAAVNRNTCPPPRGRCAHNLAGLHDGKTRAADRRKLKGKGTRLPSVGFRSWSRFLAVSL